MTSPPLVTMLARSPLLCLAALVVAATWVMSCGRLASADAMPFGDGEHYVLRALTLYGYLHTGAWSSFWQELDQPSQSLLPPNYLAFFLVPQAWASITVYGNVQAFISCALLATGAFAICSALERPTWSVPLFVLCFAQNITLDASYFYFVDTPFLAVTLLAFAGQIWAWRRPSARMSLLSGVGAALPFWTKPANAIIFFGLYVLAELLHLAMRRFHGNEPRSRLLSAAMRHAALALTGFLPVLLGALICGGFQSIVYLIAANGVSNLFVTKMTANGLLRLFYFPLCLTFFYHTLLLVFIFGAALAVGWRHRAGAALVTFNHSHLLPLLIACGIFGLYFSFGLADKELRALLIILPALWLGLFRLIEHVGIASRFMTGAALTYAACAMLQVASGFFAETPMPYSNSDPLESLGWLSRFPTQHNTNEQGIDTTRNILGIIHQSVPEGGDIAIGTEMLYFTAESLSWVEQRDLAIAGNSPHYQFNNFLSNQGEYSRPAMRHASAILLILTPTLQYSQEVASASLTMARFAYQDWVQKEKIAQIIPIETDSHNLLGILIVMKQPLTDAQFDQILANTGSREMRDSLIFAASRRRQLSLAECRDIIWQWLFGKHDHVYDHS